MLKKWMGFLIGVGIATGVANANLVQFATVGTVNTNGYFWNNVSSTCASGAGCNFHTGTTANQVAQGIRTNFAFQNTPLPPEMSIPQLSTMTINAPTPDNSPFTNNGGSYFQQSLGANATISIIRTDSKGAPRPCTLKGGGPNPDPDWCGSDALAGKVVLLTAVFTGSLSGAAGSTNSGVQAASGETEAWSGRPQSVTFTSDFLLFTGQVGASLSYTFTANSPPLSQENVGLYPHMKTFKTGGAGVFATDPGFLVPEPSSLILSGFGGALVLAGYLRKRKKA